VYDSQSHYTSRPFVPEHDTLDECDIDIRNIGWTLGNDCPYRCTHCYSMSARRRGQNLSHGIVDRVVGQLVANGIETVNLGGNEPLFTNGLSVKETLLPHIIRQLTGHGILVGLTTSGISALQLERHDPQAFAMLNDMDISLDSPYEAEHNANRGARIYPDAIRTLALCHQYGIERSIILCAMSWNFTRDRLEALMEIARRHDANVRINPLKTIEAAHLSMALSAEQYYDGFSYLMEHCDAIDLGEPPLATVMASAGASGCPCGRTSFRIHAITPDGAIPVSPCVYLHDYKVGDLLLDDLADIVRSPQFRTFRRRNRHPEQIPGCEGCALMAACRGGCAARGYLHRAHETGERSLFSQDPYCPVQFNGNHPFPQDPPIGDVQLVHRNYLCTWIGRPRFDNTQLPTPNSQHGNLDFQP
jgi:radical SAM protein with 4Fe4S-binding SPASM domain